MVLQRSCVLQSTTGLCLKFSQESHSNKPNVAVCRAVLVGLASYFSLGPLDHFLVYGVVRFLYYSCNYFSSLISLRGGVAFEKGFISLEIKP